jgi:hypothetical protein
MAKKRKTTIQKDPQGKVLSTYEEEEEDDSLSAIIPDGGTVRVRMTMMDSVQRAVAQEKVKIDTGPMIVDAFGQSDRYSLSKPGARYLSTNPTSTDYAELATREQLLADAYADADAAASNAWRGDDMDHPLLTKTRGTSSGQHENDRCTIDGRTGRLRMLNNELVCVVGKQDAQSAVEDAYREYDQEQQNAWRS